ncbi:MAG: polysaccharide deacetylase family protein [Pseudomonadota bacterium]
MPLSRAVLAATLLFALCGAADAADCPRSDALGTSRVLAVDPKAFPQVGTRSFPQTLPLADKEVVLTFDDGPRPQTTRKILDALARECVQATFFMIGENAAAHPQLVRAVAAAGHTVGHHSWNHPNMSTVAEAEALANIDRGIAADETALHGRATTTPSTPFFRFPYFASTPALLDQMQERGLAVFGADLWASDWTEITPQQELNLATGRLQSARKGIILFHDTKARTAAMLPDFLRFLRTNGYRIVHIVPKAPETDERVTH